MKTTQAHGEPIRKLASKLAGMRSAGFCLAPRVDRLLRDLTTLSQQTGTSASIIYALVSSEASQIQEDNRREAAAWMAQESRPRRKAI